MTDRLKGKVAIVTGAGSRGPGVGNGKAAAILFAREGASVFCVDLNAERAQETVSLIEAEAGVASAFVADVTNAEDCVRMARAAVERYRRIDILQNNVGIPSRQALGQVTAEEWDAVMAANVRSVTLATQAATPLMAEGGAVINLSSIAAVRAYPSTSLAYSTSKAAIIGLTVALAGQLGGRGIRVNCIAPGQIYTPLVADRLTPELRQARATAGILKAEGTAWDVAWASVFLASDEARWITGQTLFVDAGLSIALPGEAGPLAPGAFSSTS
ncbi:MAG: SDR family oxidoreductase [Dehalococcoidia bacterium]|nr:SDR family oxidoreductase [Dehalococcoidia bacterium]